MEQYGQKVTSSAGAGFGEVEGKSDADDINEAGIGGKHPAADKGLSAPAPIEACAKPIDNWPISGSPKKGNPLKNRLTDL